MAGMLAVDLGAESGRVIRGDLEADRLRIREISRFPTGVDRTDGHLRWDLDRMLAAVFAGIAAAGPIESVGVDGWGVDFGLVDGAGHLLEPPVAYRDARTQGVMEEFLGRVPREEVYGATGIQFLPFNTLYQLAAMARAKDPSLSKAKRLLMIPDLVNHALCGSVTSEATNATTTQCFDARTGRWVAELVEAAGVDPTILPEVVPPATILGPLANGPAGLPIARVIAPATHDTGSAVAAVPAEGSRWAFLSSGTWSLLGLETDYPLVSDAAREANVTNEGGIAGTNRLLKNVMGLWLVQRLRADLKGAVDYESLVELAAAAPALVSVVDPDELRFLNPPSMREAIESACRESGEPVPRGPGALVRCALESLALKYRAVLLELMRLSGREIETIHVVGGGSRNRLLSQMTADATGLEVRTGPVEATAIGNLLGQALALGHVADLGEARALVRHSFETDSFFPRDPERWAEAAERIRTRRDE